MWSEWEVKKWARVQFGYSVFWEGIFHKKNLFLLWLTVYNGLGYVYENKLKIPLIFLYIPDHFLTTGVTEDGMTNDKSLH